MEEHAEFGWDTLAWMLSKSVRSLMRRRQELMDAGVIMYTLRRHPTGSKYRTMFFFPSIVKAYLIRKASKGETF